MKKTANLEQKKEFLTSKVKEKHEEIQTLKTSISK